MLNILKTNKWIILSICILSVLVNTSSWIWFKGQAKSGGFHPIEHFVMTGGDSRGYVEMADSIHNNGSFEIDADPAVRGLRTPGYPLFLSGVFMFERSVDAIAYAQIFVAMLTVILIYCFGLTVFGKKIGLISSIVYIFYPMTPLMAFSGVSETLFVFFFFLLLCIIFVSKFVFWKRAILAGLVSGVLILIRPIFELIMPLFILYEVISLRSQKIILLKYLLLFITFVGLVVFPWMYLNWSRHGHATLSTAGSYNLLYVNTPRFLMNKTDGNKWFSLQKEFMDNTVKLGYIPGSIEALPVEATAIKNKLNGNILSYAIFHVRWSITTLFSSGIKFVHNYVVETGHTYIEFSPFLVQHIVSSGLDFDFFKKNIVAFGESLVMLLLTLLLPVSLFLDYKNRNPMLLAQFLFVSLILAFAVLAGPFGDARYRFPVQALIFMISFSAIYRLRDYFGVYLKPIFSKFRNVKSS